MRKELAKKKQSKLKHYISTPMRILKKAKELYVKGVVDCTGALGVGVASSVQRSKRELSGKALWYLCFLSFPLHVRNSRSEMLNNDYVDV